MPRRSILPLALLLLLAALVHGRSLRFGFVGYDDPQRVLDNPFVSAGLSAEGLRWAWTTTAHAPYWHPLTWLTHMVDCELWGVNPAGHHATNVALHLACVATLFLLLLRASGELRASLLAAALFALHPVQVGTVAWISARPDLLATLFALLALRAYVSAARGARAGSAIALALVAALLSKPVAAVVPLTMLLLDGWPLGRSAGAWISRIREKAPWFALAAAGAATVFFDVERVGGVGETARVSLPFRLANATVSYVRYLGKLIWPADLAAHYPHPNLPGGQPWSAWQIGGAAGVLVGVTLAVLVARRRAFLRTGWLWYLIALIPVSGLFQVGDQAMAGRYLYFPAIGIWIACAWVACEATDRAPALVRRAGLVFLLAAMAWGSWHQSGYWRDSRRLFERELSIHPQDPWVHYNLAVTLGREGESERAERHYRRALEIRPGDARAHNNLGDLLREARLDEEAREQFRRAVELAPGYAAAWNNLGNSLRSLGRIPEALRAYRRALSLRPGLSEARLNLASALHDSGRAGEAVVEYRAYVESHPTDARARNDLAWALIRAGETDPGDALAHAEAAAVLTGYADPKVLGTLSEACLRAGQRDRAARVVARALALPGLDPAVAHNLERQRTRILEDPTKSP